MNKIKKMSQEWVRIFKISYEKNLPILIDAFVEYYGLEFKNYITSIIKSLKFDYVLNETIIYDVNSDEPIIKNLIQILNDYFYNVDQKLIKLRKMNISNKKILRVYINRCIIKNISDNKALYNEYKYFLTTNTQSMAYTNDEVMRGLILPIFFTTNNILIHEINHLITTHFYAKAKKGYYIFNIFEIKEIDELINQMITFKISKIFENKGGNLNFFKYQVNNTYNDKLFLIEDFYNKFENIIKTSLITGNRNIIEKKLGRKNLEVYISLIKKLYHEKTISLQELKKIKLLVLLMEQHLKSDRDYNYDLYFNYLENSGNRIRRL